MLHIHKSIKIACSVMLNVLATSSLTHAMHSGVAYNLYHAVLNGNKHEVEQVLQHISPLKKIDGRRSLFQIAVESNQDEIVALCVNHISQVPDSICCLKKYTVNVNAPFESTGLTPLETAIFLGHVNTVRELVCNSGRAAGIDIDHGIWESPIHMAATLVHKNTLEILEILHGAGANFNKLINGDSVLDTAQNTFGQDPRVVNKIKKIVATKDRTGCKFLCWFLCWFALWYSGILELSRA